jgi:citrate lyase beta subunit
MNGFARQRLERSTLLVPASNPAMIAKAALAKADAVCIDCEDAVAPNMKADARLNVIRALCDHDFGAKLKLVRINGLDTHYAYRDIVDIVEGAGSKLDLIVVPKVSGRDDLRFVDQLLTQIEAACGLPNKIGIEALIETAAGVLNIRDIVQASPRLEGLIYGSGDYAASVGMPMASIGGFDSDDDLYPGHRWHFVMHAIVSAAHAHDLRAIDGPFADIRDADGLTKTARIARAMGFDGKWCIHPSQPPTVDLVFEPSDKEIAWADKVMDAYASALAVGRGAITVDGRMVDAANLRMCEQILARMKAIKANNQQP